MSINMDALNEADLYGENPVQTAKRLLVQGAPFAAQTIVTMSTDDTVAPSVRLRAAQYIIDRQLGPVGGAGDANSDPLDDFLNELSDVANGKAPRTGR